MITSKSGLLGHAMTIQPSTESKSCPHCGKTDFDYGVGCYAPRVSSPAVGDWVCSHFDNSGPIDLDPYECPYCHCVGGHVDGCVSVDPDLEREFF